MQVQVSLVGSWVTHEAQDDSLPAAFLSMTSKDVISYFLLISYCLNSNRAT